LLAGLSGRLVELRYVSPKFPERWRRVEKNGNWNRQNGSGRPGVAKGGMDKPGRAGGMRFKRYERVQVTPVQAALEEARVPWQPTERWVQEQFRTGPFMEPSIRTAVEQFRTLVGRLMGAEDVPAFLQAQQAVVQYVGQHPFLRWAPVPAKPPVPAVKAAPAPAAGAVKRPVRLPVLGRPGADRPAAAKPGAGRPAVGRDGLGLPGAGRPSLGKPAVGRPVREPREGAGEGRAERPVRKFGTRPSFGERPERTERGERPVRRTAAPLGLPSKAEDGAVGPPVRAVRKPAFGGKPTARPGDKPAGRFGDKPAGRFGDKPAGRFGDKPAGRFGDKPAGRFGDKPAGRFGDKPAGRFGDKPAGKFVAGKPGEKPAGKPGGKFAGKPGSKFARKPGGKPAGKGGARKQQGAPATTRRRDTDD
jgi:hypothetical protein